MATQRLSREKKLIGFITLVTCVLYRMFWKLEGVNLNLVLDCIVLKIKISIV